jgi:hypothetical protein
MTGHTGEGREPRKTICNYNGTAAHGAWCRRLAQALRLSTTEMVEEALRLLARHHQFDPPPPRKDE